MLSLTPLILPISFFLLVFAVPPVPMLLKTCYREPACDIDPQKMRQAIELIPSPSLIPLSDNATPDPGAYRLPAMFQVTEDAQILVRGRQAKGMVLDPDTLMTKLWPKAKETALGLYTECSMASTGLSGRRAPLLKWTGPPYQELMFQVDMTCRIDKSQTPGVTTYTPTGVQGGMRLGEGRSAAGSRDPWG